jgi:hypothetical protein
MEKENSEEHKCVFSNGVKILVSDKNHLVTEDPPPGHQG